MEAAARSDTRVSPLERALGELITPADEAAFDTAWLEAQSLVRELTLRPAKRLRPRLLQLGYELVGEEGAPPSALWRFAVGLEVLHTFLLVHDDVADRSDLRRGGPTLHRSLNALGDGGSLAVVVGDHLFAHAIELMLSTDLSGAAAATRYYLGICRHTAVGQYLDLVFSRRALEQVTAFDALKVAHLKTAKYSFAAPLACGTVLADPGSPLTRGVERVGRLAGLAFQLRDDLLGIFGATSETGKPGDGDLAQGKRTFPLLVAYRSASPAEREVLERLGRAPRPGDIACAREIIRGRGGVAATERAISRATHSAVRTARALPVPRQRLRALLDLVNQLAERRS